MHKTQIHSRENILITYFSNKQVVFNNGLELVFMLSYFIFKFFFIVTLENQGTKGPRDKGTKGQRDQGTKGQRDQGTKGQREDQYL